MTAHEEMTKSRLALERALVKGDAVEVADAIDRRIKTFILLRMSGTLSAPREADMATRRRMSDILRDALYEIAKMVGAGASNDPPQIAVPEAVRRYINANVGRIEVDGVSYGESMIRELRDRARDEFNRGREGGIKEAIELVDMSGPDRPWRALIENLKNLLPGSAR